MNFNNKPALSIDTLAFYYEPYKTYLLDNYTRFTTMEEVLREYVVEVNVGKEGKRITCIRWMDRD